MVVVIIIIINVSRFGQKQKQRMGRLNIALAHA